MNNSTDEQKMTALWQEIDSLSQSFYDQVYKVSKEFWDTKPSGERLNKWLQERVWSEREGAKMHAYVVVQMAEVLEPHDLIFLSQQATDEARHWQLVGDCLKARGLSLEGYEPTPRWRAVFQENYDVADTRDPILLFSILHMGGEGPASATAKAAAEALRDTPDSDIARAYERIYPDEAGHWKAGRDALKRHATTLESLERSNAALQAKAQRLFSRFKQLVKE